MLPYVATRTLVTWRPEGGGRRRVVASVAARHGELVVPLRRGTGVLRVETRAGGHDLVYVVCLTVTERSLAAARSPPGDPPAAARASTLGAMRRRSREDRAPGLRDRARRRGRAACRGRARRPRRRAPVARRRRDGPRACAGAPRGRRRPARRARRHASGRSRLATAPTAPRCAPRSGPSPSCASAVSTSASARRYARVLNAIVVDALPDGVARLAADPAVEAVFPVRAYAPAGHRGRRAARPGR